VRHGWRLVLGCALLLRSLQRRLISLSLAQSTLLKLFDTVSNEVAI